MYLILYLDSNIVARKMEFLGADNNLTEKVEKALKFKSQKLATDYILNNNLKYDDYCVCVLKGYNK